MDKQVRVVTNLNLQVRGGQGDEDALVIGGRAIGYNCLSEPNVPGHGCRERISPGAFRSSISGADPIFMNFNHSHDALPLASSQNSTLQLDDRKDGLYFTCRLNPRVSFHRDLHELCKAGTGATQCSFEFAVPPDGETWSDEPDEDDRSMRWHVRQVNAGVLYALTLCQTPAYGSGATFAQARGYRLGNPVQLHPMSDAEWETLRRRALEAIDRYHVVRSAELAEEIRNQR